MRFSAGLALACAMAATQVQAAADTLRPFTIDDQLGLEDFGRVAFSPDGRWLVAERYGPYRDAPNFDHEFLDHQTVSRIFVTDLRTGAAPRALLAEDPRAGDTFGAFSPDGARILVFRLKDRRQEMGVVEVATGAVTWTGLTVDTEVWSAQARWRDNHHVVAIARAPDAPSLLLGAGWQTQARTQAAWAANGRGDYSGVTLGSGRYVGVNPPPATYDLAVFDVETHHARVLARGAFVEMSISPDGGTVALMQEAELTAADTGGVVRMSAPPRRRRLLMVDLNTGASVRPCPACDLAPKTWAWSPEGKTLVAAARDQPAFDATYGYWRMGVDGSATPIAPDLRVNLVYAGGLHNLTGQVAWLAGAPVVLARPVGGTRPDWWRISAKGPVNLTAGLSPPQGRALAADANGLLIGAASGVMRLAPAGQARRVASAAPPWQGAALLPGLNASRLLAAGPAGGRLLSTTGHETPAAASPEGAAIEAFSAGGAIAAITKDAHGARTLTLYSRTAPPRALLAINTQLDGVAFSAPKPVKHPGPKGETLTSWLYLPPGSAIGADLPVVIVPYAGDRYDQPPGLYAPGSTYPLVNVQLIVAQGYAVLAPSLPLAPDQEPANGLSESILRAVDAAHEQYPSVSTTRLALWGQSFGGWSALMAGTQSPRFRALVASAPATDLITLHSSLRLASLAVPEVNLSLTGVQGWAEGGQGRMGGPPWSVFDRYVRNSPLLQADKITAPVMLIYGDMDFDPAQATAMFMSLSRQGKDAQLLYYRGEGHVIVNPANVRDLYRRAFAFLADALGPPPASGAADAPPTTPGSASEIRRSQ